MSVQSHQLKDACRQDRCEIRTCPVCEGELKDGFWWKTIRQCSSCESGYVDGAQLEIHEKSYFDEEYRKTYEGNRHGGDSERQFYLSLIARYRASITKARHLDVGCALGAMLVQSKLQGWIASGVELSPYAAQIAAETSRVPVSSGTLEEACFPDAQFDVITMMDVIEHLAVPRRTIQECYRILAPGGVLCFVTPNFRSACVRFMRNRAHGIWPDAHLVYFTKDGARKMLSSIGFSRIEIGTRDIYAQNIALLLGKDNKSNVIRNSFAARPAQALLRRAVNAVLWRLPIGDKLVALARKPAY